jgi:ribulose-5-phosphate 4-epimerase/fuculose-1-phosphate aldolase
MESPYSERHIHASVFKRYPSVNSVVHSHSPDVVAFSNSKNAVTLKPVWHMAGFLNPNGTPVWELPPVDKDKRHLLVNSQVRGDSLAAAFAGPVDNANGRSRVLGENVVLQRSHGFVVAGDSLPQAVYRAIYTCENAKVQQKMAALGSECSMSEKEAQDCSEMNTGAVSKAWPLWLREAEISPLYSNELDYQLP